MTPARRARRFLMPGLTLALMIAGVAALRAAEPSVGGIDALTAIFKAGKFAEAETAGRALLASIEKEQGADSLAAAAVLDILADTLTNEGRSKDPETRAFAERAVAIKERLLGADHPEVARSLTQIANIEFSLGDYAAGRAANERILAIQEKALGPDDPAIARTLYNLSISCHAMGDYAAALPLAQRSLRIFETALGPDHANLAYVLNVLAAIDYAIGDFDADRRLLERALAIQEKALGPDHPSVGWTLTNLALAHRAVGDAAGARPLDERAIALQEKTLGPDHPLIAKSLKNLALVHLDEGDYPEAQRLIERAYAIQEKALGPEHAELGFTVSNLGDVLYNAGDLQGARPRYERAIAILEKALGPDHPEVATNLAGLALVLYTMGDAAGALPLYERAQKIWETAYGSEHRLVGWNLVNLANVKSRAGDDTAARALFERGLAIEEKTYGPDHPELARGLDSFAAMNLAAGRAAEARDLAARAVAIETRALGADHPAVAASLNLLALIEARQGESGPALQNALEAERIARQHLRLTSRSYSEDQALRYAAFRTSGLELVMNLAARGIDAPSRRLAMDALVRSRAVVLDEMAARHRAVAGSADAQVAPLVDALAAARARLANLVVRGPGDQEPAVHARVLDGARQGKEQAERALAGASRDFARERSSNRLGLDEVAASLPAGSALVAFAEYRTIDLAPPGPPAPTGAGARGAPAMPGEDRPSSYLVFLLRAGERDPQVMNLGDAAAIDQRVAAWLKEASDGLLVPGRTGREAEKACRAAGAALRTTVWDPLAPALTGVARVFVVPDGALNLMNLAALPAKEGGYLIEAGPLVHYLSAERDLVPSGDTRRGAGLLALGDPDYDTTSLFAALDGAAAPPAGSAGPASPVIVASAVSYRGRPSTCADFASVRFGPLPATGQETRDVMRLWAEHAEEGKTEPAELDLRAAAGEAALKRSAPGRRILHLATHGFFLGGACRSALDTTRGLGGLSTTPPAAAAAGRPATTAGHPAVNRPVVDRPADVPPPAISGENPLVLSGLALAGANHRAAAGAGEDDGILTAEEIASLDLSGVEWAVLSACETGIGDVRAGEGVFGLRRAFQIAGAGTLIMSLWSVDDAATRAWMKSLYEARLGRHLDTAEAARAAGLDVLRDRRARRLGSHPFYWAAFVAVGDWR